MVERTMNLLIWQLLLVYLVPYLVAGYDVLTEAADVVLMDDKPSKIAVAIRQARRTLRIARENTWFAVGIKIAVLILAFFGLATMWMAVFADVGVTVLAVLNAARTLK